MASVAAEMVVVVMADVVVEMVVVVVGGGGGRGLLQRCSYCGMNGHTEDYCWDKWGKHECMMKICNSPLLPLDMMLSVLIRFKLLIPPLHLNKSSKS